MTKKYYLTVGAVFKNETKWLREWLEYHRLVGVEHFYLLNNDDEEEKRLSSLIIAPYVSEGLVTCLDWPVRSGDMQVAGYQHLAETYYQDCVWLAFLDLDEFFLPLEGDSLRPLLESCESLPGGLALPLATFGTANISHSPSLQTRAFVLRAVDNSGANWTVKYALQTSRFEPGREVTAHRYFWENGDERDVRRKEAPRPYCKFRVNHYATRSLEDWRQKSSRGWPPGRPGGDLTAELWEHKFRMVNHSDVVDDSLWRRFGARLTAALGTALVSCPLRSAVSVDPDVQNYVRLRPFVEAASTARQDFEEGRAAVYHDVPLDCDLAFLRSFSWPATYDPIVKKAKVRSLLAPLRRDEFNWHLLAKLFPGDFESAARFQVEVERLTAQMDRIFADLYPGWKCVDTSHTWRLTSTVDDSMHYDTYGTSDDRVYVRLFLNLDDRPRLWATTYPIQETIRRYGHRLNLSQFAGLPPNEFNEKLNEILPWTEMRRHYILLAPLALWTLDSRLIGHEAVYGRRLLAYTYICEPSDLANPENNFVAIVRRWIVS